MRSQAAVDRAAAAAVRRADHLFGDDHSLEDTDISGCFTGQHTSTLFPLGTLAPDPKSTHV